MKWWLALLIWLKHISPKWENGSTDYNNGVRIIRPLSNTQKAILVKEISGKLTINSYIL